MTILWHHCSVRLYLQDVILGAMGEDLTSVPMGTKWERHSFCQEGKMALKSIDEKMEDKEEDFRSL